MQSREFNPAIRHASFDIVLELLAKRKSLLDAVVFSGGEPTIDPALPDAIQTVKALGFEVGLHTSGCYPEHLKTILPELAWVGLDIKAPLTDAPHYARVACVPERAQPRQKVEEALGAILAQGIPFECRTTAHPAYLDTEALLNLAKDLAGRGVTDYALQIYRKPPELDLPFENIGYEFPGAEVEAQLKNLFPHFVVRRF